MEKYSAIFKAYDIRGVYPKEIDEEIAFKIGREFYQFIKGNKKNNLTIVVGKDNRLSSDTLTKAVKKGIKTQGGNIIDIGLATTPLLYFGVRFFKAKGGINVTASHNPSEYNGFKLVREKAIPFTEREIKNLGKIVLDEKIIHKNNQRFLGQENKKDVLNEYLKFNLKFLEQSKIAPLKIVIDTANGVCGILIKELTKKLKKVKIYHLFPNLNGKFPNHIPDPSRAENLKSLKTEVFKRKADFGVGLDGDGDRIIFVDEKGRFIRGDFITALVSKIILREKPGEKILYEITSTKVIREAIEENGGKPIESKVGTSFIHEKMRKENIIFGGEISGHYYFRENDFLETPLFVLFKIIEEISIQNKSLSKIILPFKKYVSSGVINFEIKNKIGAMKKVENYFLSKAKKTSVLRAKRAGSYFKKKKGFKISHLDGVKIDAKDFWILVRPSNTEPLLRLSIEADNKKILNQKIREVKRILGV